MIVQVQEYVAERGELLRGQVRKLRESSVENFREVVTGSVDTLKGLKSPVRLLARSSIKLSAVSQEAVQNLIELQSDVVTSAINEVALRLERATKAENIVEFVREQIELTPATRDRIVEDANRAVTIIRTASRDIRAVAKHAYEGIVDKGEKDVEAVKATARRKTAKRAPRKTTRARKTAAPVAA